MATTIFLREGMAHAVYDDRWKPLLEALGLLSVQRATSVEWDEGTQQWVATHLVTQTVIARGSHRDVVIEQEVRWLEQCWLSATGKTIWLLTTPAGNVHSRHSRSSVNPTGSACPTGLSPVSD